MVADKFFDEVDFGESDEIPEESLDPDDIFEEASDHSEEDDYRASFDREGSSEIAELETQNKDGSFFRSAIITVLVGAILGGASLFGFNKYINVSDDHEISFKEPEKVSLANNEKDQTEFTTVVDDIELFTLHSPENMIDKPVEEPPPRVKKTKYFISVANCLDDECVRLNRLLLKKQKIRSIVVRFIEKTSVFEVVSEKTYDDYQAAQWVKIINQTRQLPGQAYRKLEGKQFRLSLGLFPEKDSARHALLALNQTLKGHLNLILQTIQQKTLYQQIRTRNYSSKNQVLALQKRLLELDEKFPIVWVEEYSYYL